MRDNSEKMLEIVRAEREGDLYFGVVAIEDAGERRLYRFGTSRTGYLALTRALDLRPFDAMPGVPHRYFFTRSYSTLGSESSFGMQVRVEQGSQAKAFEVDAPKDLIANLLWFAELGAPTAAEHLRIPA